MPADGENTLDGYRQEFTYPQAHTETTSAKLQLCAHRHNSNFQEFTITMSPLDRALESLEGLSIGDAFGQCFFQSTSAAPAEGAAQALPEAPWYYTDDTEMTLSVISLLAKQEAIDQDLLAQSFAEHYHYDRAYGPSMHRVLERIRAGEAWQQVTTDAFGGQGSWGNGAAMRVAPLGAYFTDDLDKVVQQAELSAVVTHAHPEATAGAIAVALAAAEASRSRQTAHRPDHGEYLQRIISRLPASEVRSRLQRAQTMTTVQSLHFPIAILGNGTQMSAQDTVPYALWCCAQALEDFERAEWLAVSAEGDRDTLCAIVGGVVAAFVGADGIPAEWRARREPLPTWHLP